MHSSQNECFSIKKLFISKNSSLAKSFLLTDVFLFQAENQDLKDENSKLTSQLEQAQSEKDREIEKLKVSSMKF